MVRISFQGNADLFLLPDHGFEQGEIFGSHGFTGMVSMDIFQGVVGQRTGCGCVCEEGVDVCGQCMRVMDRRYEAMTWNNFLKTAGICGGDRDFVAECLQNRTPEAFLLGTHHKDIGKRQEAFGVINKAEYVVVILHGCFVDQPLDFVFQISGAAMKK